MKTLIAYSTKYGTTLKCATLLKEKLNHDITLFDVSSKNKVDISSFDCIIIGGPVYIGKLRADAKKFCEKNLDILLTKKIGLFICHLEKEKSPKEIISKQYPNELAKIASAAKGFGGASLISKMKGLDKFMFTKMAKNTDDKEDIDYEQIEEFVKIFNQ